MAEIIKVYKQDVPPLRFIGKKYGDDDRVNGMFGHLWGEWFENESFEPILLNMAEDTCELYEDCYAYVGLMRWKEDEPFEYWIGMLTKENTVVPDGYDSMVFDKNDLGVCWIQGLESEVFGNESKCGKALTDAGYEIANDEQGAWWFFERYHCPRFTEPDEKGRIILDVCHFIK